jgi:O-antigen/teichoic acid export membrane protein
MKKQFNSSILLILENVLIVGSALIFVSICTNQLTIADWGTISANQYFFSLLGVFLTLSLNAITMQRICMNSKLVGSYLGTALTFQLVSTLFISVLIFSYVYFRQSSIEFIAITIIFILTNLMRRAEIFSVALKAFERPDLIIKIRFFSKLAMAIYVTSLYFFDITDLRYYAIGYLVDSIIYCFLSLIVFRALGIKLKVRFRLGLLMLLRVRSEIPNNILITVALSLPLVLLEYYKGVEALAPLSISLLLMTTFMNAGNAICDGFYRYFVDNSADRIGNRILFSSYIFITFWITILLVSFLYVTEGRIITFIFGAKYQPYIHQIISILVILCITMPSRILYRIVYLEGLQKYNKFRVVPGAFISLLISVLLISNHGAYASIIALFFYYLVGDLLGYLVHSKIRHIGILFFKAIFTMEGFKSARLLLQFRSQ